MAIRDAVVGYMCKIDFDHELGAALGGSKVYPSIEDLRSNHDCVDECGIVEVTVSLNAVISEGRDPRELLEVKPA